MLNLKRFFIIFIFFSLIFAFSSFEINSYAANIDMNLASEHNVTDEGNPGNNIRNSVENTSVLDTNTATNIESINSIDEYNEPTSNFGVSQILNILLIAVGVVIILLAIAILIRLGK